MHRVLFLLTILSLAAVLTTIAAPAERLAESPSNAPAAPPAPSDLEGSESAYYYGYPYYGYAYGYPHYGYPYYGYPYYPYGYPVVYGR